MTDITDTRAEIDTVRRMIVQGKVDAMAGLPVHLDELAHRTERLCAHLTSCSGAESRPYLASLQDLIDDIDALAAEIKGRLGAIRAPGEPGRTGPAE